MPNPIARGGLVAAFVAVTCVVVHIGGWNLAQGGWLGYWGPVYLVALPPALLFLTVVVAPLLRRHAHRGPLTRTGVTRLGAACFGLAALFWMVLLDVGPPVEIERWLATHAPAAVLPLRVAYNAALTPAVFALYGALAARAGWWAAFGRRREVDAGPWLAPGRS